MSSLKKIICLANSWKLDERCIAGLNIETGQWVRPVCDSRYPQNGKIPTSIRLVAGREPKLLDILEIPLADSGNDFGFECENLSVQEGQWQCLGKEQITNLLEYCESYENFNDILHNSGKYVNPSYLKSLPFCQRRTLQLVRVVEFYVEQKNSKWRGTIQAANGSKLEKASITDPVFVKKLDAGYNPSNSCLITVSLSMPWSPPDWEGEIPCWKLIAGVIEIETS